MQATRTARRRTGSFGRTALEEAWIRNGGDPNVATTAAAIALAESGGNTSARNPSGASGAWQILGQVVKGNIFNLDVNAKNAVKKYEDAGNSFSPWVTFTTGAYAKFMPTGEGAATGIFKNNPALRKVVLELQKAIKRGETGKAEKLKAKLDELTKGAVGESPQQEVEGAVKNPLEALSSVGSFFELLTKGETWLRLGEIIAGAILLYLGLKSLTGSDFSLPGSKLSVPHAIGMVP